MVAQMSDKPGRIMIAAPSSGSGKTTLVCGLLKAFKDMGLDPAACKCGPDYIDPMFHRRILEIGSGNLDSYLMSETQINDSLLRAGSHPVVIEGAMGIYDGTDVRGLAGSSHEIAVMTQTPIVLCVDAYGMGRTLISVIKGILKDDTERLIKGIVLNRVSAGFYVKLRPVLEEELKKAGHDDVKLLGNVPSSDKIAFESRHLGLMLPDEIKDISARVSEAADLIRDNVKLDGILELMKEAPEITAVREAECDYPFTVASDTDDARPVLAVARDEAFCFYYQDNLKLMEKMGVTVRYFSPIHDEHVPEDAAGLLLGGGYPELHLDEMSRNKSMLESVARAINGGMPSLAECGGFMYLHKYVSDKSGKKYKLAGVIDGECTYAGHLVRFGYMTVKETGIRDNAGFMQELTGMRGHEFHYYESTANGDACVLSKPDGETKWTGMIASGSSLWGFPHFYYGSAPGFAGGFADSMRSYERTRRR